MSKYLKARGLRRDYDEVKAVVVCFNHAPTGEQFDEFMAYVLGFVTAEEAGAKVKQSPGNKLLTPAEATAHVQREFLAKRFKT